MEESYYFRKENLFAIVAALILFCGFIMGFYAGTKYPVINIDYEELLSYAEDDYSYYDDDEEETEDKSDFNTPLMIYVWLGSAVMALGFYAIHMHLSNQEKIIKLLSPEDETKVINISSDANA